MRRQLSSDELKNIHKPQLIELIDRGIIRVMASQDINQPKESLPEYKRHSSLRGINISIGDASRKYKIPHPTISRWVKRGIIPLLGYRGNRTLIDEADIAYCSEIYHKRGGSGKWIFNLDGTPYYKKN